MRSVNTGRVLAGGLLAGLVMNLGHWVAEEAFLGAEIGRMLDRLGLPMPSEAALASVAVWGFVIGLVAVWLYAGLRTHYSAGPRTALRAAAAVWTLACLFPNAALLAYGVMTPAYFWLASVSDLVLVPAGTLVGARLYRDRESDVRIAAQETLATR